MNYVELKKIVKKLKDNIDGLYWDEQRMSSDGIYYLKNIETSVKQLENEINKFEIDFVSELKIQQEKIDKAIEYIERYSSFIDYLSIDKHKEIGSLEMNNVRELLEILKGDSNEN